MTFAAPSPPAIAAWGAAARSLSPELRQALAAGPGREALLLPALAPAARRAARLLLQDAARLGDGTLIDAAGGEVLLLGSEPAATARAAEALGAIGIEGARRWPLEPEDAAPLLDWAARAAPAPRPAVAPAALLHGLPADFALDPVLVHRTVLRLGPDVEPARVARRILVSRRRMAEALAPAAADPDLLEEAAREAEARLATSPDRVSDVAAGLPAMLRPGPGAGPPPGPGAIAILPLAACAEPEHEARIAALRDSGWAAAGWDGLDAVLLPLIDPGALPPGGPVLLRWSPALADRAAMQALRRRLDPARLVLTGCNGAAAVGWGLEAGIREFSGPAVEALMAAARARAA